MGSRTIRPVPPLPDVKGALRKISESSLFSHSTRQIRLLEYLCNKVLLGEAEQIKAATIAMEVFGRPWDFDETKDAIVRVEAHRLRKKLTQYYERDGALDRVRIVLSPGGYVPEFEVNDDAEHAAGEFDSSLEDVAFPASPAAEPANDNPASALQPPASVPAAPPTNSWRPGRIALIAAAVALTAALAVFAVSRYRTVEVSRNEATSTLPPGTVGAPAEIRILCGRSAAAYTDRFGRTWGADAYSQGGTADSGPKEFYGRPPDAGLFATMRTGEFSYHIPVRPGVYELRLYWAEPLFRLSTESIGGGENQRRFNVSVNGKLLLDKFDVVADSGISPVDIRAFSDVRPAQDGKVHIAFAAVYGTPFLNAVELIPSAPGRALPVRIRAHDLSYTDHLGRQWTADNYYVAGRLATHKQPVTGTPDAELYASERYGNFSYVIPVPDGRYSVTLHFAETWFRPDSAGEDKGGKGDRVFDVYCNGAALLRNFDVLAQAGSYRAITKTFHGVRPNGQGKIILTFAPEKNYATVKAIEVVDER